MKFILSVEHRPKGVERTKVKRLEMKALVDQALAMENQLLSAKDEDSSLKAGISSL